MKNEAGLMIFSDPGSDKPILEAACLQCVHCGGQFPAKPHLSSQVYGPAEAKKMQAAGRTMRGYCQNCDGPICSPECAECVPVEQYLENMERGVDPAFKPAFSSLSGAKMWLPSRFAETPA